MVVKTIEYEKLSDGNTQTVWTRKEKDGDYWEFEKSRHNSYRKLRVVEKGEGHTRDVAKQVLMTALAEHDVTVTFNSKLENKNHYVGWEDIHREYLIEFIDFLNNREYDTWDSYPDRIYGMA